MNASSSLKHFSLLLSLWNALYWDYNWMHMVTIHLKALRGLWSGFAIVTLLILYSKSRMSRYKSRVNLANLACVTAIQIDTRAL